MKYRFTAEWARLLIVLGYALIAISVLAGITLFVFDPAGVFAHLPLRQKVVAHWLALVLLPLIGFLLGAPLIVSGELIQIFLDQRRLLARIARRLRPQAGEYTKELHILRRTR